MPIELKIPEVGESITEVQIGEWLKKEGDSVQKDEPLVVIESDKASLELPAPEAGKLSKITHPRGDTVAVGEVIGQLDAEAGAAAAAAPPGAPSNGQPAAKASSTAARPADGKEAPGPEKAKAKAPTGPRPDRGEADPVEDRRAPSVQARAPRESGSRNLDQTPPGASEQPEAAEEGGAGNVDSEQETALAKADVAEPVRPEPEPAAPPPVTAVRERRSSVEDGEEALEEAVPMSLLRRTAARRLVEAKQQMAMLTTFNEADLSAVQTLRREHREAFEERHQVKLGLMSFFVKATVEALRRIPQLNSFVRGHDIVYRREFNIGVAIAARRGLVVPVIRRAERLSFADIERAIDDFARRANDGKLKPDELQGATFTITNGGVFGSLLSTPIINPPQAGILGMHTIQERPIAVQGQVVIRPMMYLALTYDHRIVDGREAVLFTRRIKELIESPTRLLLEI